MGDEEIGVVGTLIWLVVVAFYVVVAWKIFEKAGKPGWAAIIPVYNVIVILEIVGRPIWWIFLLLIPLVGVVVSVILSIDLAKSFGHGALYGFGLAFLSFVFGPILAFGSDTYQGPSAPG
ncbi:MAG: DUF5684 domain-containing protein [Polyangiales bacterium]